MYVTEPGEPVVDQLASSSIEAVDVGSVYVSALWAGRDGSTLQTEFYATTSRWLVFAQ